MGAAPDACNRWVRWHRTHTGQDDFVNLACIANPEGSANVDRIFYVLEDENEVQGWTLDLSQKVDERFADQRLHTMLRARLTAVRLRLRRVQRFDAIIDAGLNLR